MAPQRETLKYCMNDYLATLMPEERSQYLIHNTPLLALIYAADSDEKSMSEARKYDEENGTDLLAEVIRFRMYCMACHQIDCDCGD
jgi:hypothetical protein